SCRATETFPAAQAVVPCQQLFARAADRIAQSVRAEWPHPREQAENSTSASAASRTNRSPDRETPPPKQLRHPRLPPARHRECVDGASGRDEDAARNRAPALSASSPKPRAAHSNEARAAVPLRPCRPHLVRAQ